MAGNIAQTGMHVGHSCQAESLSGRGAYCATSVGSKNQQVWIPKFKTHSLSLTSQGQEKVSSRCPCSSNIGWTV
eukprot:816022-Amphidinium_carterae.1